MAVESAKLVLQAIQVTIWVGSGHNEYYHKFSAVVL
jgi:hypothetical protein